MGLCLGTRARQDDEEFVGKVIRLLEDGSLPKATAKKVAASLKKPENLPPLKFEEGAVGAPGLGPQPAARAAGSWLSLASPTPHRHATPLPPASNSRAGAAQKGGSAIIIIFGAVAFGACVWGISQALFPGASSTQVSG